MPKPRVLVLIDWYSPGFKAGGPVRSMVNLVEHLRDRIDFHIVTTDTDYTEHVPYPDVVVDQWVTRAGGEQVWYSSRKRMGRALWKRLLNERSWDTVYINGMYSWWFSIWPLWCLRGSAQRRVVAVRGMLAAGMMEHGALKKRVFLHLMRMLGCYKGVQFQATNAEEVADVHRWIGPDARVHLVPNLGRKPQALTAGSLAKEAGTLRLVSVARIAVEKNTRFAIEQLHGLNGTVTFDLYGPIYDQAYWTACQEAIAALPANISVRYQGTVAADAVPSLLRTYHALFMPSQGENFGHTMVEALAAGLPLLISDRTPWKNLRQQNAGWDLPLEEP
ncbi:MAG: glycosyltransferase family 4 protein, partial [Flavobacteriales bacterium]|nr:glycosyltransferase family 4 protein [Flavobacteriales bacterium]